MNAQRVEELFNEITTGIKCVSFKGRILFFHYPSSKLLSEAAIIERKMELEWGQKIPRSDNILHFLTNGRPEYNVEELKKTKEKITNTINHLLKTTTPSEEDENLVFYQSELNKIERKITRANKYVKLSEKATDFYCLDAKIQNYILVFLLTSCTYFSCGEKEKLYFREAKFSSEKQKNEAMMWLLVEFNRFRAGYTEEEIRAVARSGMVSNIYNTATTTGTPMFPGSASEYTHLQNILLFWCRYYFNVMKNLGLPEDPDIINNDKQFDEWVKNKVDEIHNPRKNSGDTKNSGSTSVSKHKIVFKNPVRASL